MEYVFFPLSHVLRLCQNHPGHLAELATKCLRVLLQHGWKVIQVDIGQQLLLLLTFFASGTSSQATSEELQREAYGALANLFDKIQRTPKGTASLVNAAAIPALAHCLAVVLEGVTNGPSSEVQLEALLALKALWTCIKDQQTLSTFLPGTVSALTRCLIPSTKTPRSRKVLISGLDVFQTVLTTVVSDIRTRNLEDEMASKDRSKAVSTPLTKSWLKATGAQIKLALANIVRLRKHKNRDVRKALERMCLVILDECHDSLTDSAALIVETSMILASFDEEENETPRTTDIKNLAIIYPSISDLIKSTVHSWVLGLPGIMQSSDESAKESFLHQLARSQQILLDLGIASEILDNALAESLRNGVVSLLELLASSKICEDVIEDVKYAPLIPSYEVANITEYKPFIMPYESQSRTWHQLHALIISLGPPETQIKMAGQTLQRLRNMAGNNLVASFWLSFQLLRAATSSISVVSDFINAELILVSGKEAATAELYDFALSVLTSAEGDDLDWRVRATALEVVAYIAGFLGQDFRLELVDTLYPVLQLLGSTHGSLREHAIATLNIISNSCGYQSTSAMIVDNADYLVNTVSLKLNNFDMSPQVPQVLVMMMHLSGPSLLPYLDDVVSSIFAALDNFHGYHRLVESFFSVLEEVVLQSGNSNELCLTTGLAVDHLKVRPKGTTTNNIATLLKKRRSKVMQRNEIKHENFPREPWKSTSMLLGENDSERDDGAGGPGARVGEGEIQKLPPTKVYKMTQSIVRLAQHYLTSPSSLLRRRLLDLISTASNVLRFNEDEFLPLINDIWPVLVKRLHDEEPFVVISASRAVGEICKSAGDFMSTRVQVEWRDMMTLAKQIRAKAYAEKKGPHGRGIHSQNSQLWDSIAKLFLAIVKYVRIGDDAFDEALELLGDLLSTSDDVRNALSVVNADAVWLYEYERGRQLDLLIPVMEGCTFVSTNR